MQSFRRDNLQLSRYLRHRTAVCQSIKGSYSFARLRYYCNAWVSWTAAAYVTAISSLRMRRSKTAASQALCACVCGRLLFLWLMLIAERCSHGVKCKNVAVVRRWNCWCYQWDETTMCTPMCTTGTPTGARSVTVRARVCVCVADHVRSSQWQYARLPCRIPTHVWSTRRLADVNNWVCKVWGLWVKFGLWIAVTVVDKVTKFCAVSLLSTTSNVFYQILRMNQVYDGPLISWRKPHVLTVADKNRVAAVNVRRNVPYLFVIYCYQKNFDGTVKRYIFTDIRYFRQRTEEIVDCSVIITVLWSML